MTRHTKAGRRAAFRRHHIDLAIAATGDIMARRAARVRASAERTRQHLARIDALLARHESEFPPVAPLPAPVCPAPTTEGM